MAINPFRVGELQLPQPLRPVPIDFSPLQSIGEGIGQYRQQQQIGGLLAGATDEAGNLDPIKAATALARAGFTTHAERLMDTALRQKALTSAADDRAEQRRLTERGQDITKGHYGDMAADLEKRRLLDERRIKLDEDTRKQGNTFYRENPLGIGPGYYETLKPDGTVERRQAPAPAPTAPAPSTIGPRSDVGPGVMPGAATFADRFDPENAPPTRVATLGDGLLSEPPIRPTPGTQTAQAGPAPAPTPAPLSPALQDFAQQNGPDAARVLKDILEYKRGPLHGKEEAWISAAQRADPNYDPLEWERRQKEAKLAPKQFTRTDIDALTEDGSKAQAAQRFTERFKPGFSGLGIAGRLGIAASAYLDDDQARKIHPQLPEASAFWRDYENFKNDVRKGTFGATLTTNELQAFERANVSPNMSADRIKEFLGSQQLLIKNALARKATGYVRAGYDPKVIAGTYGLELKDLGVTAEGRQRGGGGKVDNTSEANDAIGRARNAYRQGAPRDAVLEQMRKDGIPNPEMVLGN